MNQEIIRDDKLDKVVVVKNLERLIAKYGYNENSVKRYLKYYGINDIIIKHN